MVSEERGHVVHHLVPVEGHHALQHAADRVAGEPLVEIGPVLPDKGPHVLSNRAVGECSGEYVGSVLGAHGTRCDVVEKTIDQFGGSEARQGSEVADFGQRIGCEAPTIAYEIEVLGGAMVCHHGERSSSQRGIVGVERRSAGIDRLRMAPSGSEQANQGGPKLSGAIVVGGVRICLLYTSDAADE